jgi:hypothetical protein
MNPNPDAKILVTSASPRGWHRLQVAAECLQKYAWEYKSALSKEEKRSPSPALAKGSLMHLALAHHYARIKGPAEEYEEPEDAVRLIAMVNKNTELISLIINIFRSYVNIYGNDDDWKVLEVESLHDVKVGKYRLTGRMDLVIEDRFGRVYGVDHKTAGRIQDSHQESYALSGQMMAYGYMLRQKYGDRFAGMKINMVQMSHDHKFRRFDLRRSPNFEARFPRIIADIEESIERLEKEGRPYDDWPKAMNEMTCYGRYGACQFASLCQHGEGIKLGGDFEIEF